MSSSTPAAAMGSASSNTAALQPWHAVPPLGSPTLAMAQWHGPESVGSFTVSRLHAETVAGCRGAEQWQKRESRQLE